MMLVWEEIHGFTSPGEYTRFVQYIEGQVMSGAAKELPADPLYGKGMIYGGRWYKRRGRVLAVSHCTAHADSFSP